MRSRSKFNLGTASAAIAFGMLPITGFAQTVDAAEEGTEDSARTLGQITVTAQRRSENLQDVPVSVTALTADQLDKRQISDVNDLQAQIPNVVISTGTGTSSSARIFFRGVGEDESRGAVDPAVGIYIDGVYLGRTVGSLLDLIDTEQIEVLRGPQGTLYGRNTNGGAIKVTSVAPQFDDTLDVDFTGGSDERFSVRGVGNLGFGDHTALRVGVLYKERDGFFDLNPNGIFADNVEEDFGDEQVLSFRGSLLHNFNSDWSAQFTIDYTDDDSEPTPSSIIAESDDPSVVTDVDGDLFTVEPLAGVVCSSVFQDGCFTDYSANVESFGTSLKVDGNLGLFSVESISAFRSLNDDLSTLISFPFSQETEQDQFSQELNLSSNFSGPFNFVSGLYYYDESVELDTNFAFIPAAITVDTQSFAVFGQGTYDVTEAFTLTGGVRYTTEERDFTGNSVGTPTPIVESLDTDNVTFTVKADYSVTEDILVYASFATGFKTPGFSPDCFSAAACFASVEEENLNAYEAGLRTSWFENALTLNATYFFNDYEDLQISGTLPTGGFTRINAGEARIQGIELESNWYPIDGLNIYAHASWLDAEYRNLNASQAGLLSGSNFTTGVAGPTCTNVTAATGSPEFEAQTIECALDLDLKGAPEIKASVGFLYEHQVQSGGFFFGGDLAYEDDSFSLVANNPGSLSEPGVRLNARAGYEPAHGGWRITVWGKNLTDREFFQVASAPNRTFPAPPLTWGVDIGLRF